MRLSSRQQTRPGTTILENSVVLPITFFMLLIMVVGSMVVFRYQETASLARSAARYASTHGNQYRKDAGKGTGTAGTFVETSNGMHWYKADPTAPSGTDLSWTQDICDQAVMPGIVALNPGFLSMKTGWPPVINQADKPDNWPGSKVSVTVTYQWTPEIFWVSPIYLTSTSTMYITN